MKIIAACLVALALTACASKPVEAPLELTTNSAPSVAAAEVPQTPAPVDCSKMAHKADTVDLNSSFLVLMMAVLDDRKAFRECKASN